MTRLVLIERILRQIYNGQPSDDSSITKNLVNSYINDAIAMAAKNCYKESIQLDGIAYVNNSFYTTYKGISIAEDENGIYKLTLPQIPVGLGKNEGVATLQFKDSKNNVSYTAIPLNTNQIGYYNGIRPLPNKIVYWPEGIFLYIQTTLQLFNYTAIVRMVSGGDSNDLNSVINVPEDYLPLMVEYISKILMIERQQKSDDANDGSDNK